VRDLLEQYVPRVYRFALRLARDPHKAEELTQETFLRAWRGRRRLRHLDAARTWLFKIAVNLWRDQIRRAKRSPRRVEIAWDDRASRQTVPEQGMIDEEDVQFALVAMDSLPARQRQVLYLHACEELSIDQIAGVLGITTDAAKASLSLARKAMRRKLKDSCRDRSGMG
jgi:RNA polymerase sigma-70 factor (ECF subfamily)